ncbi:MAG: hypothetical protein HKN82_18895, partial [Akkermansiaceae bacterium]|nr:hypothetical protein [Akkermansiaceae bacterium]
MTALRLGIAVLGMLALGAQARTTDLPPPPDGHVFDAANSLGDRRRDDLEAELARIRNAHRIDIHAVAWDRELPQDGDLAALAARLGDAWAREDRWVVVLQAPGNDGAIVGAHRGFAGGPADADAALA